MNPLLTKESPLEAKHLLNQQINDLRKVFSSIIADEMISDIGLVRLNRFYRNNNIKEESLNFVRNEAFRQAAHLEIIGQGTAKQETYWLLNLAIRLGISPDLLDWLEEEVSTLTILNHIQTCDFSDIPRVKPESAILKPDEYAFAELPAMLVEENAINPEYAGGLAGISFRLARGIRYRIGEKKSELLLRSDISPSGEGYLILTNQRMIFSGATLISIDIGTLFGTRIFADSIQFATIKDEKLTTVGFKDPLATEYCGVVLSRALNK